MEETEAFAAASKNTNSKSDWGTGVFSLRPPFSFSPAREAGDLATGDGCRGAQKQPHAGGAFLTAAAGGGSPGIFSGRSARFTVAAGDATQSGWQSAGSPTWPSSFGKSTMYKSTLNPDAKEFRLSSGQESGLFAHPSVAMVGPSLAYVSGAQSPAPLFAVPSAASAALWQSQSTIAAESVFSAAKSDATKWPQVSAHPRHAFLRDFAASAAPLTPRSLVRRVTDDYANECRKNGYHMVAVFNLEPRTTQDELLAIFFPMCAKKAELLPSHYSPRPNRRAGVVFFPSKAFAVMAVEKLNNFVPNRQHQPLSVRYCSFETSDAPAQETAPAASATHPHPHVQTRPAPEETSSLHVQLPWRLPPGAQLDRIHEDMWRFVCGIVSTVPGVARHVVVVHGLDPESAQNVLTLNFINKGADRYDLWPVKSTALASAPMPCVSVSALVWFKQELTAKGVVACFQQKEPEGQTQPIDVVYLNAMALSNKDFLTKNVQMFNNMNRPGNNDQCMDNFKTSYVALIAKIDEFFLREYDDPKLYLVGVHNLPANTDKKALFSLFSPHGALDAEMYHTIVHVAGEVRASGVAFFDNEVSARKAAEKLSSCVAFNQPYPVVARYLEKHISSSAAHLSKLPSAVSADTRTNVPHAAQLNALILAVKEKLFDSVVDADQLTEKMMQVITHPDTTVEVVEQLAFVIVDTLTVMKHHAGIVSTPLVNALMSLHEKLAIPRSGSKVLTASGETCDPILAQNINYMQKIAQAVINLLIDASKPHESRKVAAVLSGYMFQFCYIEKSPYELAVSLIKRNEKSINLARECMMNSQMNLNPTSLSVYEEDEHKPWITLMECLELLTSLWRQNNKSRAKKDSFRGEYERRAHEFAQGNVKRTGGAASLNTSTRPTPRRVVAKVTPGTGGSGEADSPGLTHVSPSTTRANLRTAGENHGASHNMSLESSPVYEMPLPARYAGDVSHLFFASSEGNAFRPTSVGPPKQQQQQQLLPQKTQQREKSVPSGFMEVASSTESMKSAFGMRAGAVPMPLAYTHAELMERTVYITKLPSNLRRAQFRRLLLQFGEFNKVRLCRDENQFQLRNDIVAASGSFGEDHPSTELWFSFVEFFEPSGAKAMIEYFRNVVTHPNPFGFLLVNSAACPDASHFTAQNIRALLNVRTSPARKPIHDQLSLDAVLSCASHRPRHVLRHRPCLFGVEDGDKFFDTGVDGTLASLPAPKAHPNTGAGSRSSSSTCGGWNALPAAVDAAELQRPPQTAERCQGDAMEDEVDLNTILGALAPTEAAASWAPEFEAVAGRHDTVYHPLQVSWLDEMAHATHRADPLADVSFGAEDAAGSSALFAAERTCGSESRDPWLSCAPLGSNHFFDCEGCFGDEEDWQR